jgi:hypothetical protein
MASKDVLPLAPLPTTPCSAEPLTSRPNHCSAMQVDNKPDTSMDRDLDNDLTNELFDCPTTVSVPTVLSNFVPTALTITGEPWRPETYWFNDAVMHFTSGAVRASGLKSMHQWPYPGGKAQPFTPVHFNGLFSAATDCYSPPAGWMSEGDWTLCDQYMPKLIVDWETGCRVYSTSVHVSSTFGTQLWHYIKRVIAIGCNGDMDSPIIARLDTRTLNMSSTGPFAPVFDYCKGVSRLVYGMYTWAFSISELKNDNDKDLWTHAVRMLICLFRSCVVWRCEIMEEEHMQQARTKRKSTPLVEPPGSNDEYPPFFASPAPASTRELWPCTTTSSGTCFVTGTKRPCPDNSPERSLPQPSPTLINSPIRHTQAVSISSRSSLPTPPERLSTHPKPRPRPKTKQAVSKPFFGPWSAQLRNL